MPLKPSGRREAVAMMVNHMKVLPARVSFHLLTSTKNCGALLDDPRILAIAKTLLGDDFNYMGSDGNFYVGDTRWHSDGGHKLEDPMHIKIAFYLDPLTRDTGALRVIPGSHLFGDNYGGWTHKTGREE